MCLIIVQVGAIAVNFFPEVVTRSMYKPVAKPSICNNSSSRLVDFPACDWMLRLNTLNDEVDGGIEVWSYLF